MEMIIFEIANSNFRSNRKFNNVYKKKFENTIFKWNICRINILKGKRFIKKKMFYNKVTCQQSDDKKQPHNHVSKLSNNFSQRNVLSVHKRPRKPRDFETQRAIERDYLPIYKSPRIYLLGKVMKSMLTYSARWWPYAAFIVCVLSWCSPPSH